MKILKSLKTTKIIKTSIKRKFWNFNPIEFILEIAIEITFKQLILNEII